jgi:pimeloyl-ACP methyl ester carboxylesterase
VQGEGEPLVLIPGLLQRLGDWRSRGYTDAFASRFRVIAIDPLGHGASDKPHNAEAYLRDDTVADVLAVLDAEGIDTAHVWGYSRGAAIALRLGTLYPARLRSLIAGGASVAPSGPAISGMQGLIQILRDGDWGTFFERFGIPLSPETQERFAALNDPRAIAASMEGGAASGPAVYDLAALSGRVLAYAGTDEAWLRGEGAVERYAETCRGLGVRPEFLEGLGHAAAFQAREQVEPLVLDFLDAVQVQLV